MIDILLRSLVSHGVETLHNIYDSQRDEMVVQYHSYHILRRPEAWLAQTDEFILSHLSTSPEVEPPDFCDNMRSHLLYSATQLLTLSYLSIL